MDIKGMIIVMLSSLKATQKLTIALVLTTTFLIVEVIAGLITQSLALLSDAAHMFTDAAALAIALAAIKIAKRPADNKRTFGYQRFEILAALFNASMLFLLQSISFTKLINDLHNLLRFRV